MRVFFNHRDTETLRSYFCFAMLSSAKREKFSSVSQCLCGSSTPGKAQ